MPLLIDNFKYVSIYKIYTFSNTVVYSVSLFVGNIMIHLVGLYLMRLCSSERSERALKSTYCPKLYMDIKKR